MSALHVHGQDAAWKRYFTYIRVVFLYHMQCNFMGLLSRHGCWVAGSLGGAKTLQDGLESPSG